MICQHCGAFTCPDGAGATPGSPSQLYCDRLCARGAAKARRRAAGTHQDARRRERARKVNIRAMRDACRRKRHFKTMQAAMAAKRELPGYQGGVYKCGWCEDWHITSRNSAIVIRLPDRLANGNGKAH